MVRAIELNKEDAGERLRALRLIVAQRLDETDSARETGTLARCILDIENALRSLAGGAAESPVDELLAARTKRGAR